jgi:hypothetical protein
VLNLLLTLCLSFTGSQADQAPTFEEWLVAYRGELHLEEYLRHELILIAAESVGALPTPEEVDDSLKDQVNRRIKNAYAGDREAWVTELKRLELDEESWSREQRIPTLNTLIVNRLVQGRREISEAEFRAAWEESYGPDGRQMTVRWIQIMITPPTPKPNATREEVDALREASRALTRTRAEEIGRAWSGGADFIELQSSTGSGEEPREPFPLDEISWPDSLRRSIRELSMGEVSTPQAARGAWNLLQLVSSKHTPFESVRAEITATLTSRPANSDETDALFADLMKQGAPSASLDEAVLPTASAEAVTVIGQLHGRPLKLSSFTRWLTETHGRPHRTAFEQMRLIERLSLAAGHSFSPEEVASRRESDLEARVQFFHEGERSRWLEELKRNGRTLTGWRREAGIRALHDLSAEALFLSNRVVSAAEVRAEWEEVYGEGGLARTARFILLTPKPPKEQIDQDDLNEWLEREMLVLEVEADELRRRVVEGGEDFAALARRHSRDAATRLEGGRLPGLLNLRQQSAAIAAAVEPLKRGGVSQPVRLLVGVGLYQIITLEFTPLDDVRAELSEDLRVRRPSAVELSSFVNQLYLSSKR